MNFDELNTIDLNLKSAGTWPAYMKGVFFLILFLMTIFFGYYVVLKAQLLELSKSSQFEQVLRHDYESKHRVAYNLLKHQEQLVIIETQLKKMLDNFPVTHETPKLLDDITLIATTAGLRISAIKWGDEVEQEHYIEFPLYIDVIGEYHQLGQFVNNVANLSRIVVLHDFKIEKQTNAELAIHVVAKTYRYKGK